MRLFFCFWEFFEGYWGICNQRFDIIALDRARLATGSAFMINHGSLIEYDNIKIPDRLWFDFLLLQKRHSKETRWNGKKILEFLFYGHFRNKNDGKTSLALHKTPNQFFRRRKKLQSIQNEPLMKYREESLLFKRSHNCLKYQKTRIKRKLATMQISSQIAFAFFLFENVSVAGVFWGRNIGNGWSCWVEK